MIKKYSNIFFTAAVLLMALIAMCFVWNVKLRDLSMPIQHTAKIASGEFNITIGNVNEIMVKAVEPKAACLELIIFDENNVELWRKQYDNIDMTESYSSIETFEEGSSLELKPGKYRVECRIDGEIASDVKCCFVEHGGSFKILYTVLCILLLFGLLEILIVNNIGKDISLEKAYIIIMLTMGIIFNFVLPPLGVPDEESHFLEAYRLSSQIMFQDDVDSNSRRMLIRADDYDSITYLHNIASIAGWYDSFEKGNTQQIVLADSVSSVSRRTVQTYLIPAVGITIARILGCSGHVLLLMGRLFNLFALTLLVAMAIKITPYGKEFFFILGLLPEVVHLFASYSYDGMNLVLCMLIVSYFLHLYLEVEKIGWRQLLILIILFLLMIPIKVVYVAFGILLFMIPKDKLTITRKQIIVCIAALTLGVVYFLGFRYSGVKYLLLKSSGISLKYIYHNPIDTCVVYLNTIFGNTLNYVKFAFGQIVGRGRYMEHNFYVIPLWMWMAMILLLVLSLEDTGKNKMSIRKRIVVIGIGLVSYIAILTAMFFASTGVGDEKILGVQGRYLLPIFALLPVMVKNSRFRFKKDKRGICIVSIGMLDCLFIFLAFCYYATNYFI